MIAQNLSVAQFNSKKFNATPLLNNPKELRECAMEQGFLFFKDVLPKDKLLQLRIKVLHLLNGQGLLNRNKPLKDGLADLDTCSRQYAFGVSCGTKELYENIYKLSEFHEIAHQPELLNIYRILFNTENIIPHPRNIMRLILPMQGVAPTPPHQDFTYINGTVDTWTSWIPLGDAPAKIGSLAIKNGSHQEGLLNTISAQGAGGRESVLPNQDNWIELDYEIGDFSTFSSLTVHKALKSTDPSIIRISLDLRYQDAGKVIHPSSLTPHENILEWAKIYEAWKGYDQLKYYWEKLDLKLDNTIATL